jgi:hypothetical protein
MIELPVSVDEEGRFDHFELPVLVVDELSVNFPPFSCCLPSPCALPTAVQSKGWKDNFYPVTNTISRH